MRAEIKADGTLLIYAANDLEAFALRAWWERKTKSGGIRLPGDQYYDAPAPRFMVEVAFPRYEDVPEDAVPVPTTAEEA